jgi:hypothetical protein
VSKLMFEELKGKGETAVVIGAARASGNPLADLMTGRKYYRGTLRRVEAQPVPMPVLLDGKRTTLPALHARGEVAVGGESGTAEFWILDDADYPLTLKWSVLGAVAQVVRVDNPVSRKSARHGGDIRSPRLNRCPPRRAAACTSTPAAPRCCRSPARRSRRWRPAEAACRLACAVEGHTDNIGSKDANQALSQRRAERCAMHCRSSSAFRRTAEARGFGADRPVENNATIEAARITGAWNCRQCK